VSNTSARAALDARRAAAAPAEKDPAIERAEHVVAALKAATDDFAAAMPTGRDPYLLVHDVTVALRRDPALLVCSVDTILGAAMTCAQLGLRVGVLGHAWITAVPIEDTAQLIIGYQGYRELAFRSGLVADVYARPVHQGDYYDVDMGTRNELVHKPPRSGERGQVTDFYAIAHYTRGGHAFHTMTLAEVEAWRDRWAPRAVNEDGTPGPVIGPWVEHFEAMAAKTAFRALAKWMPKSAELDAALAADTMVRVDRDPRALGTGYYPAALGDEQPDTGRGGAR
jgi:recombination protein RecT